MEAYGYLKDGEIVAPVAMCSRFNNIGAWHTLTDEERALHGWYPCKVDMADFNYATHYKGSPIIILEDGIISYTVPIFEKSLETVKYEATQAMHSAVSTIKQFNLQFNEYTFQISDIDRLIHLTRLDSDYVLIEHQTSVVKMLRQDLHDLINKLLEFEQKILSVKLDFQHRLCAAVEIEEVIAISPQEQLMNILEN